MHDESTADDANRRAAAQAHAADVHRRLERFFDLQAPIYDATRPFVLHGRDAAVELLDVRLGDSVLELACGTGLNFPRLRRAGASTITGVDLSAKMLARAARRDARPRRLRAARSRRALPARPLLVRALAPSRSRVAGRGDPPAHDLGRCPRRARLRGARGRGARLLAGVARMARAIRRAHRSPRAPRGDGAVLSGDARDHARRRDGGGGALPGAAAGRRLTRAHASSETVSPSFAGRAFHPSFSSMARAKAAAESGSPCTR